MGLPQYTGPFNVGAIDLEIPVRNPSSFGSEYVSNDKINKPRKRKSRAATVIHEKAQEAAERRHQKGDSDLVADEAKHKREEVGQAASTSSSFRTRVDNQDNDEWNPFASGSKTTTLHLSTVLFTVFYPSEINKKTDKMADGTSYSNVSWMGRPKKKTATGFVQYMGNYGSLAYIAAPAVLSLLTEKLPAIAGAPLADPCSEKAKAPPPMDPIETGNFGSDPAKFPLIIFSHGLAGSRLSYSQFCGELASHGVIVAAMEHRDGSGISSLVRVPQPNSPSNGTKAGSGIGKMSVPYFAFENVGQRSFAEKPSEKEAGLRKAQMDMRSAEIMECLHIMREIDRGNGEEIAKSSTRGLTSKLGEHVPKGRRKLERSKLEAEQMKSWKGRVDSEFPCLVGHSFGACSVIEMQRKPHKTEGRDDKEVKAPFPFSILFDPWVEPLEWRGEGEAPDPRPMIAPAFAINSESFTIWKDHFMKLKRIMHDSREADKDRHGWLFTLCGCQHLDFSDFPFLLPHVFRSTVGPKQTISVFCRATYSQMGLIRQRRRDQEILPGVKTNELAGTDEQKDEDIDACKRGDFSGGKDDLGQIASTKEDAESITEEQERRRKLITEERRKKGLVAHFASRTPSGHINTLSDQDECIDFSETAKDVSADEDAGKVHEGLEDISRRLEYKKPKIHSLMGFMLRLSGLKPGLASPGKVLIHQY
jgi:platelet-activating factor acetylhydrolase